MSKFKAVLFIIGKPTPTGINGSRRHPVKITENAVYCALRDLPGKPLWRSLCLFTHDRTNQIGTIQEAYVVGDMFCIEGEVNENESVDLAACDETLGVSFDAICDIADMRAPTWEISRADFIGATVLLQRKAGHKENCLFWLEAA